MHNFDESKLELLRSIEKLTNAIDNEVDWFLASSDEKDPKRKEFARKMFFEKQAQTKRIAKEEHERFKQ